MVVAVSSGVVKVALVCPAMDVPPVGTVYHLYCPAAAPAALNVNAADPHEDAPVVVGGVGERLIVAITGVRALSQVPSLIET